MTGTLQAHGICALGSADRVNGLGGNDVMQGGKGSDCINDKVGRDKPLGGGDRDTLSARDRQFGDLLKGSGGKNRAIKDRRDKVRSI